MSEHYDFHYQPTGSGAISGQQVLEQTEDAINELGDYVNDNVGGAMDVAQQALETAQTAETNAQTALDTANSFSSAIQSAQQDASTALSTAQTAQTTASNANNTAIQASQDASSAVTTANNASGQVNTLSGTVTALGQRVTTAEGNIGQNTSDITALTTRVGTAEGNITTLQNDVTIAQGNASSAMATAGTVKQQSYVLRYSSASVTDNSTIAYSTLDNTDNIKSGDKVIDVDGKIFTVVSVDMANQTVTVGSALIDLALDGNVVHVTGNETVGGNKTLTGITEILRPSGDHKLKITDTRVTPLDPTGSITSNITWQDTAGRLLGTVANVYDSSGNSIMQLYARSFNANDENESHRLRVVSNKGGSSYSDVDVDFLPSADNKVYLGSSSLRWKDINTKLINGLNPGVLSLPSQSYVDISSYFTNTGTGEINSYTAQADGWIFLRLGDISSCQAQIVDSSSNRLWGANTSGSVEMITIPILSGCTLSTQWTTGSSVNVAIARFYPCQGNV